MLSEIWFNYDLDFKPSTVIQRSENCPDRFDIYFRNENAKPVWEKYDFYVMTVIWPATFCQEQGKECYKKLKKLKERDELNIFTIHGLWPSYSIGIFPQWCNLDNDIEVNNFTKDMENYWINIYKHDNKEFWEHEYNKHGMCYNQRMDKDIYNYDIYFEKALEVYHNYKFSEIFNFVYNGFFPRLQKVNKTYLFSKLSKRYLPNSFYLSCKLIDNEYYLDELRFQMDINFNLISDAKIVDSCPEEFMLEIADKTHIEYDQAAEGFWETYDLYIYSQFFQQTTCKKEGYQCYLAIENFPKNIWTIHGLWPSYKNGTIENWCNGKNDIDIDIKNQSLYDYMVVFWPGLYSTNESFWGHEYNRHGYCYNQRNNIDVNDYETFF